MTLDPGAIGEWLLIALIVGGGITIGGRNTSKKIAKQLNEETAALAKTRGETIDDLRDEIKDLEGRLLRSETIAEYLERHGK